MLYLIIFFTSFLMVMILTPVAISLSREWGLVDHPDARKNHDAPMVMAGGPVLFPFVIIGIFLSFSINEHLSFILTASCLIFALGAWDDRFGVHFSTKFLIQIVAALLVMQSGLLFDLNKVDLLTGMGFNFGRFFSMAVTLLWIVGITNAVNIIDGMDGLAAGLSFNAFAGIGAVGLMFSQTDLGFFCFIMSGALLGFLRYNIYPARTFLGDSGSMLLGFTLAVLSIVKSTKTTTFLVLVVPVLLLALPVFDTFYAFARRGIMGQNPFKPDRGHLHHKLLDLNFTQKQVLGMFFALSTGMGLLALRLAQKEQLYVLNLAVFALILSFAAVKAMQVYNFHGLIRKINLRMRKVARRAVEWESSGEERLWKNFVVLTGLCSMNILISLWPPYRIPTLAAASMGIIAVGVADLFLSKREEKPRFEIMHLLLFVSLVLNQIAVLAFWHSEYLIAPHYWVLAFLLLGLLVYFIYRTGIFAAFLQDPMEILALFSGIVVCGLTKDFLNAPRTLPFAVILTNALVLYIMLKIYLVGYRVRSLAHSLGFMACVAVLVSIPWWG